MNGIKGLMKKDLLNLSHYKVSLIVCIIIFGVIGVSQKSIMSYIPIMFIAMFGMIALSTFSYDEIAKSDKYILSLPTDRKQMVKAKYILSIGFILLGAICSFLITILLTYFVYQETPHYLEIIVSIVGGIFGISFVTCVQIPSVYKWGAEKGRIQMFIMIILVMAIIGGVIYLLTQQMEIDINAIRIFLQQFGIIAFIVATIGMYGISYWITNKIYARKEI